MRRQTRRARLVDASKNVGFERVTREIDDGRAGRDERRAQIGRNLSNTIALRAQHLESGPTTGRCRGSFARLGDRLAEPATLATHPEREREPGGTAREVARESGDIVIPDAELHQRHALGEDVNLDQRVVRRVERLQRERAGEPGGKAAKRVLRRAKRAKFGLLRACGDENARCETSAQ